MGRGRHRSSNPTRRRRDEDDDPHEFDILEKGGKGWSWMKEKKYKRMFEEIEGGLEGVLGSGSFDWVDRRVFDQVFDRSTLMGLYKLMKNGTIDTLEFPIARGKEAHVFYAIGPRGPVAVKIFHTSNAVFKNLMQYIEGDPRFGGLKRRHRDLVTIWVRKEHRNLTRLKKWNLRVPEPIAVFQNVLVMEYLGNEEGPSPKLRDVVIEDAESVFDELLEFLCICWNDAKLVHADFSPYNILWHDGQPMVIDVGQAVALQHPNAKEFLVRDVTRLVEWANKRGVEVNIAEAMYEVLHYRDSEEE
ncbi:MAG: serine protein kinase RIO [Candidatus Poseidoniaceae archaeon]|nr:serine protein kinase RIO [Candidatus Poseidoniaceae archaeon]